MKKIIAILAVAAAALCFSACESNISGDFIYTVNVNADTSESTSWQVFKLGEPLIKTELKNAGGKEVSSAYVFSGHQKVCDKTVKKAVNTAMDKAESDPIYDEILVLGGTEVVVTRLDSDGNVEIMKRTYKVKK